MRWSIKGLGFVNTIILARMLAPQDYGVVAMAMLIVGLIQAFLDFGVSLALIRKDVVTKDEIDSAWTLGVIQGWVIGLLLLLASPLASVYFQEPRVLNVLVVVGFCIIVSGSGNIGLVLARRELNFSLEFHQQVVCKFLGVCATIVSALFMADYRALVIGVATGYLSGFITSYLMHPYRPRWNTQKIGEIWEVTKWLTLAGIGGFLLRKSDELIAARIGSTHEFGMYNVGSDLGQLPTGELGPAMLRAFLPVLSAIQNDWQRTNSAVLKTLAAVNTITLPVGFGFAAVALPATAIVLGPNWLDAAPLVAAFAMAGTLQFAMSPLGTLLTLRGHTRVQSRIVWAEFAAFVAACALLVPQFHLLGLVWSRILASLCSALLGVLATRRLCGIPARHIVVAIWRPFLGSIGMALLVSLTISLVQDSLGQLVLGIVSGAVVYSAWTLATWHLAGKPEGFESTVMDYLQRR
jgi:O-antigen/teichoic acid export membrane protein